MFKTFDMPVAQLSYKQRETRSIVHQINQLDPFGDNSDSSEASDDDFMLDGGMNLLKKKNQ